MRHDKYLKVSRIIKRRTVANNACDWDNVSVIGRPAKASYNVKPGDIIEIKCGQGKKLRVRVVDVRENATKSDADSMYEVIE